MTFQTKDKKENLGISTGGNRKRNVNDTIQQATDRVLQQVAFQSAFFDQVEPYKLPKFERSEIEIGDLLGRGEYGDMEMLEKSNRLLLNLNVPVSHVESQRNHHHHYQRII